MSWIITFLATGFYSGYFPVAPGTAGSLCGLGLYFILKNLSPSLYIALISIFFGVGVWVSTRAEVIFQEKDPGCIVIDEMLGLWVSLLFIPVGMGWIIFGFILFRVMDIIKPFSALEKLSGGWGIMLDDLVAGIITNILLRLVYILIK